MSKLVRGDQLPSNLRREVLSQYVYRWTSDNPQRDRAWTGIKGAPTMPLVSDEQWLRDHAFYVTDRGTLDKKRNKHANPAYLIEDKSTIRTASSKKSPAQLDREIAEALGSTSRHHATKKPAAQGIEPLPHNREWHGYIVGQGGELLERYKGQDIHRNGIAYYVNGHYVGTSLGRAKEYVRNTAGSTTKDVSHARKVKYPPGDPKRYPGYAIASGTHGDDAYFRSKGAALRAAKRLANEKNRRVEVAHITKTQDRQIIDEVYPSRW